MLLNEWLRSCDGHPQCRIRQDFSPTRVVDVGGPDQSTLKLLETTSVRHRAKAGLHNFNSVLKGKNISTYNANKRGYVALSHCWGKPTDKEEAQYCTTKENYAARLKGFSIDNLPKTFQDAIRITRAIGHSYLWIDAVCIIQKDQEDWGRESLSMENVFSSAYCTISADAAKNWTQGFLERKSLPKFVPTNKNGKKMYECSTRPDFDNHVSKSELNKRAWVLQERFLSRRILHFAEGHTYFACGESVRCENFTTLISPMRNEYFIFDPDFPKRLTMTGYKITLQFIQYMFEEYAQAGLTKRSDKEVAISGLLQRMEDVIGSKCVHGTFSCFFAQLLLWRVSDTITDNEVACSGDNEHGLPSWSWMLHDQIKFLPEIGSIDVPTKGISFDSESQLHVLIFELRDCDMEEQGGRHVFIRAGAQIGEFWLDMDEKTQIQGCVVVGKSKKDAVSWFILLVTKLDKKRYRRLGVGRIEPHYISKTSSDGVLV